MSLCTTKHVAVITIFTPIYLCCTCNYSHMCHHRRRAHNFIIRAVAIYRMHKINGKECTVRWYFCSGGFILCGIYDAIRVKSFQPLAPDDSRSAIYVCKTSMLFLDTSTAIIRERRRRRQQNVDLYRIFTSYNAQAAVVDTHANKSFPHLECKMNPMNKLLPINWTIAFNVKQMHIAI